MSIFIKGLKMPTEGRFMAIYKLQGKFYVSQNGELCPIIELPAHGDLIDREYAIASACSGRIRALPTTEDGEDWIRVEEVRQSLKSVPAVIPAERSEE